METKNKSKHIKTKMLSIRLTEKQLNFVDEIADKHELNRSEFVRYHFINSLTSYKNGK
jgi:metal-responsive CopG/Arc/MetJ family transcriptional regulator